MREILADTIAFGRQYLRSPIGAFFAFIFPVLLILLFGAIFSGIGTSKVSLPVQDQDATPASRAFLDLLNRSPYVTVTMVPTDANLSDYIRANSLDVALEIPSGFGTAAAAKVPFNLTLFGDPSRTTYTQAANVVGAALVQTNFVLNGAQPVLGISARPIVSSSFTYMDYFLPGIVGMTVMTSSLYSMTSIAAEYRTRRYFKLLATTPLTKGGWLSAKIAFYFLLMVASLLVTLAVGVAAWQMHATLTAVPFALIAAGVVLFTSLGMLIGSVVKDPSSGIAIANAVGFPMMFLSGSFFQIEAMPGYLQTVARVLPLTYLNDGLRNAMIYGNSTLALTDLGIVSVLAVAVFFLAARLVSWKGR